MHRDGNGAPVSCQDMMAAMDTIQRPARCLEFCDNFFAGHGTDDRSRLIYLQPRRQESGVRRGITLELSGRRKQAKPAFDCRSMEGLGVGLTCCSLGREVKPAFALSASSPLYRASTRGNVHASVGGSIGLVMRLRQFRRIRVPNMLVDIGIQPIAEPRTSLHFGHVRRPRCRSVVEIGPSFREVNRYRAGRNLICRYPRIPIDVPVWLHVRLLVCRAANYRLLPNDA